MNVLLEGCETVGRRMIYLDDAIDAVAEGLKRTFVEYRDVAEKMLNKVPSAQPETATVTIGGTKGGVTMWYECDACGEPVDQKDCYCRKCGRRLKHE